MTWAQFVREQLDAKGWSYSDASRASGVHRSVWSQWVLDQRTSRPSPENVRATAQVFGVPYRDAMVHAGYLTEADLGQRSGRQVSAAQLSNRALLAELERRLTGGDPDTIPAEERPVVVSGRPSRSGRARQS